MRVLESERQITTGRLKRAELEFTVMSGNQLHERIWKDDPVAFDEIKYVRASARRDEIHISSWDGKKMAGDLEIKDDPRNPDTVWLMHVSVRPDYQNMGIAKQLLDHAFQHINAGDRHTVTVSSFSREGQQYIKHYIEGLEANYPNLKIEYNSN